MPKRGGSEQPPLVLSYTLQLYDTNYLDLVNSIGYTNQPTLALRISGSSQKRTKKCSQTSSVTIRHTLLRTLLYITSYTSVVCLSPSCPYTMILQQTRLLGIRRLGNNKKTEASYSFTRRLTMGLESASVPSSVSTPYPARPPNNNFTTHNTTLKPNPPTHR